MSDINGLTDIVEKLQDILQEEQVAWCIHQGMGVVAKQQALY